MEEKEEAMADALIVQPRGGGEKRWFYGGGLHTWKATAEEINGSFLLFEDHMAAGKMTPVHVHPDAEEAFYVLEGEIVVHSSGEEHTICSGGFAVALRGIAHAFLATTETRLLCLQTPGTPGQAFFRHASDPSPDDVTDGPVDFARVPAAAAEHGAVELLGPPP